MRLSAFRGVSPRGRASTAFSRSGSSGTDSPPARGYTATDSGSGFPGPASVPLPAAAPGPVPAVTGP
ncbi:hypothetical protein ACFP50_14525, partial [Streptomyces pratens]